MGWLHSVQRVVTLNRVHEPSLCPAGTGCVRKAGTSGGRSLCSVISDLSPIRDCCCSALCELGSQTEAERVCFAAGFVTAMQPKYSGY